MPADQGKYSPINCGIYDHLEQAATLNHEVEIVYKTDTGIAKVSTKITNLNTHNKVEYALLGTGMSVRLDDIITLNGMAVAQ